MMTAEPGELRERAEYRYFPGLHEQYAAGAHVTGALPLSFRNTVIQRECGPLRWSIADTDRCPHFGRYLGGRADVANL